MKKKFLLLSLLFGIAGEAMASPPVVEMPVYPCSDASSVVLTTYSWTKLPTSNCSGRSLVVLNVYGNTGRFRGIVTTTTTAPSTSTGTYSLSFGPSGDDRGYPISEEGYIWGLTTHTSAESVMYQEFKQR